MLRRLGFDHEVLPRSPISESAANDAPDAGADGGPARDSQLAAQAAPKPVAKGIRGEAPQHVVREAALQQPSIMPSADHLPHVPPPPLPFHPSAAVGRAC